jgi:hypothetical protein
MSDFDPVYEAIKAKHGYTLAGLVASAQNGFNRAYDEAKAEGFPSQQILSDGSQVRGNAIFDAITAQYGTIDLKAKGVGALLAATKIAELLNELVRDLEALESTSEEEFNGLLDKVRERYVAAQVATAGLRI